MTIRVAVADDHPTLLAGMEHLLTGFEGITVAGLVTDSTTLVELLGKSPCDVVVTDFSMPHGRYGDGLSLLRFLRRRFPDVQLVVLTGIENGDVLQNILDVGVSGILSKSDDLHHVEGAIRMALQGERYLSPEAERLLQQTSSASHGEVGQVRLTKREAEVLRLYAEGFTVTEIGLRVGRSSKTISAQKQAAMKKLGLSNDAEVFNYALAHGLVQASQLSKQIARKTDDDV
ncbi:response regulator [Dyella sp. 2HG41-7]|uniref:response regulator n=1 Tax=Dyella sp. 2HG41-7 TaxID=2883239 RepID=UPI001F332D34|nr:response regulator [Dyella sp. 2HG41-7]